MDGLIVRNLPLDLVEKTEEFLMAVKGSIVADNSASQHIERGKEGLSRRTEVENYRHLTTNATREPTSSRYVHPFKAQISKRDSPGPAGRPREPKRDFLASAARNVA